MTENLFWAALGGVAVWYWMSRRARCGCAGAAESTPDVADEANAAITSIVDTTSVSLQAALGAVTGGQKAGGCGC